MDKMGMWPEPLETCSLTPNAAAKTRHLIISSSSVQVAQ